MKIIRLIEAIFTVCSFSGFEINEFRINTQEEYQDFFQYERDILNCENYSLPEIDFTTKTLLGKFALEGSCNAEFMKNI